MQNLAEKFRSNFQILPRQIFDVGIFLASPQIQTEKSEILTEMSPRDSLSDGKREGVYSDAGPGSGFRVDTFPLTI